MIFTRLTKTMLAAGLLAAALTTPRIQAAEADSGVPAHPSELTYADRIFTPPSPEDYRHEIAGGVPVFAAEDHDFPLIDISIIVRTGGYLVPEGKEGLAGYTGSLMRSGGTTSMTAEEFDEEVAFLAASISSSIRGTSGNVSAGCLSKDIDRVLELMFDMMKNPAFDQARLDLQKERSLQGMKRRNDSTGAIEGREWARLMRGDNHFTTSMTTQASIESITREDMIGFHNKYFHPEGFIIAVSGDFDTDEMLKKLEKHLTGGWNGERAEIPPVPEPDHTLKPGVYFVNKPEVNQGRVRMGHLGARRDNPDRYAIHIMNDILGGGGFTSRLMSRVRSDEGLAYSVGSIFGREIHYDGIFQAYFQSKSESCAQAAAIVLEEIDRIRTEPVTGEELNTSVQSLVQSFPTVFGNASRIVGTFANDEYTDRPDDYWANYTSGILALEPADLLAAAKKYLHPDRLVILAVGNTEDIGNGNPDQPDFSFGKIAGDPTAITVIPLPDPFTMIYPES